MIPSFRAPLAISPRPLLLRATLALGVIALPIAGAAAQDSQSLFVGGPNGVILEGHPLQGDFTFLGVCGGPIHSMVVDGADLFIGDEGGNIYHYDSVTDQVDYAFTATNDATSLVIHNGDLLVGGTDATILRLNKLTGALIATTTLPVSVDSMLLEGDVLYAGSALGVVHRTLDAAAPDFQFFGTCGGPVMSMAIGDTHILLGTPSGVVYRIAIGNGTLTGSFSVSNDATAMVSYAGDVLIGGSDASVRRIHPVLGTQFSSVSDNFDIQAMVLGATLEPGVAYCFGTACPCGNDDFRAGCVTSNGQGGLLRAIGSPSVSADDLILRTTLVSPNKFGRYYMGASQIQVPFGNGQRCAGTGAYGAYRFPVISSGSGGVFTLGPGIVQFTHDRLPEQGHILMGFTWNFQSWFRDSGGACGSSFNLSNAFSVTFEP